MCGVFRVINCNDRPPPKQTWGIISTSDSQIKRGGTVVSAIQAEVECARTITQSGKKTSCTRNRQLKKRSQNSLLKRNSKTNKIAKSILRDV